MLPISLGCNLSLVNQNSKSCVCRGKSLQILFDEVQHFDIFTAMGPKMRRISLCFCRQHQVKERKEQIAGRNWLNLLRLLCCAIDSFLYLDRNEHLEPFQVQSKDV